MLGAAPSALRTLLTVPKQLSKAIGSITVNGLLAAELALDTSDVHGPWRAVLPTKDDFQQSMPVMWHASLQALLPPASATILEKQKKKIAVDWAAVSAAFPDLAYDHYLYNWLLVSTRTFYFTSPKIKNKPKPLSRDDCLALIPLADLFNHADVGCEVTFSPSGYSISADEDIAAGQEVYISYGHHSNDFLLVEYGFILEENQWDEILLDEIILPLLSDAQKAQLEELAFLGKYVLGQDAVCYRTQVALMLMCMPVGRWEREMMHGFGTEEKEQAEADAILLKVMKPYLASVQAKIKEVEALGAGVGLESQRETLVRRWKQIRKLLVDGVSRLEGS